MVGEISSNSIFVILFFVFYLDKMQLMQHYQWGYHCCVFGGKKSLQGESLLCELQHIASNIWNVFLYLHYCNMFFIHHLTTETRLLYSLHSNTSTHVWCFQPVFKICFLYICSAKIRLVMLNVILHWNLDMEGKFLPMIIWSLCRWCAFVAWVLIPRNLSLGMIGLQHW